MHTHFERHRAGRAGWLRAAVLGADGGILSTASLMIGVAGSGAARGAVLTAGLAGLTAGSLAMAIGEYVSVSSQSDTEAADAAREGRELVENTEAEHVELARIYRGHGLPAGLADEVATALMASDPLGTHLRDELGQTEHSLGRPMQAALASAASFALGAVVALVAGLIAPNGTRVVIVGVVAVAALLALGVAGAAVGGATLRRGGLRVAAGGVLAMRDHLRRRPSFRRHTCLVAVQGDARVGMARLQASTRQKELARSRAARPLSHDARPTTPKCPSPGCTKDSGAPVPLPTAASLNWVLVGRALTVRVKRASTAARGRSWRRRPRRARAASANAEEIGKSNIASFLRRRWMWRGSLADLSVIVGDGGVPRLVGRGQYD